MGFSVSTYAVRGVLVDTAFHDVRADLGAWIGANKPDGAIVTHYHEDHAGNVEFLAARDVPLWIAPETLEKVRSPESILWYRRWCWGAQAPLTSPVTPFAHPSLEVIHPWPREDVRAQIASIRKVAALKPKRYFDGHRGLVPDAVAQLTAKADWTEDTVGEIDALIDHGLDDREIVKSLFGGEDRWSLVTRYDYSRRNYVGSVRGTHAGR
jgi:glyoxylase-like metal-dependent hydrolase (beta-lactamase superfamily II)